MELPMCFTSFWEARISLCIISLYLLLSHKSFILMFLSDSISILFLNKKSHVLPCFRKGNVHLSTLNYCHALFFISLCLSGFQSPTLKLSKRLPSTQNKTRVLLDDVAWFCLLVYACVQVVH